MAAALAGFGALCAAEESQPSPPADPSAAPPLAAGETLHEQRVDIDEDGRLTVERTVRRPVGFLGLTVKEIDERTAEKHKLVAFHGVLVTSVNRDGPAAQAGIVKGDVIVDYGTQAVSSLDQFTHYVESSPPDAATPLGILRGNVRNDLSVKVGSQTRVRTQSFVRRGLKVLDHRARSGLKLAEIDADAGRLTGSEGPQGPAVVVVDILPGGPSFFSAANRQDVLVRMDGEPVTTLAEAEERLDAHTSGDDVLLELRRGERKIETTVTLANDALRHRNVHIPLVFRYRKEPHERKVSLILGGMLFNSHYEYKVHSSSSGERHETDYSMGMLLDLLSYSSSPRHRRLRLFWILPITFETTRES